MPHDDDDDDKADVSYARLAVAARLYRVAGQGGLGITVVRTSNKDRPRRMEKRLPYGQAASRGRMVSSHATQGWPV